MPRFEENKAKIAEIPEIVEKVIRRLWKNDLEGKRVLVVAGSTAEPLDEFRVLTNRSSGRMGIELARNAFQRGADVTLWYGHSPAEPPDHIYTERFGSVNDILEKMSFLDFDITIVCAAIADYSPDKQAGKIPSGSTELTITLQPTPKVLASFRSGDPKTYLVGFKAEHGVSEQKLLEKAFDRLDLQKLEMIVANDLAEVSDEKNHVYILLANRSRREVEGSKADIATTIFDEIMYDMITKEGVVVEKD